MDPSLSNFKSGPERALLVGVARPGQKDRDVEDSLTELALLSTTAEAVVAETVILHPRSTNPATFIGRGQAERIAGQVRDEQVTVVVFDDDLSPVQGRNLEEIIGVKIIDRTQLILDIFARHARTREGSLQIELAQLHYLLPRLKHMWKHLERQRGGIGLMAGAGEQQIEVDRRHIEERITRLQKELEHVRGRRAEQRRGRRRHGWALLVLVGYTNAGKSTLLNALTGAEVSAPDRLFATLDPTTRQLQLPNHQLALVTDTVGFIRKLPHHLVESFKATLEEVLEADLLIHVVDAAHPRVDDQVDSVESVLKDLGAQAKPVLAVLNKIDLEAGRAQAERLRHRFARAVPVSAITGEGLDAFREEMADCLRHRNVAVRLKVPVSDGEFLATLQHVGHVHAQRCEGEFMMVEAGVPIRLMGRCKPYLISEEAQSGGAAGEGADERE